MEPQYHGETRVTTFRGVEDIVGFTIQDFIRTWDDEGLTDGIFFSPETDPLLFSISLMAWGMKIQIFRDNTILCSLPEGRNLEVYFQNEIVIIPPNMISVSLSADMELLHKMQFIYDISISKLAEIECRMQNTSSGFILRQLQSKKFFYVFLKELVFVRTLFERDLNK
jgi:hypothetical protein